jgi:putative sigma-54 modulation protein
MEITIHNAGELSAGARDFIEEKVNKLETFYDRIVRADVYLNHDDGSSHGSHRVTIRLAVPGPDLSADHTGESVEKAVVEVAEKLRRQIRKHKDKMSRH